MTTTKEIRAMKMFLYVACASTAFNIAPVVYWYFTVVNGVIFREAHVAMLFFICVNASVNLPIYYFQNTSFRKEYTELFLKIFPCLSSLFKVKPEDMQTESTNATSKL